jgi:hypothetical protein
MLDHQSILVLADLASELFPVVGREVIRWFGVPLAVHPVLEAVKMHETHRALALAGYDQRVQSVTLLHPAETALGLVFFNFSVLYRDFCLIGDDLFQLLVLLLFYVIFTRIGFLLLILYVYGLHSKFHSPDLKDIASLDLVVL